MNDSTFNKLKNIQVPTSSEEEKQRAINAGIEAFEQASLPDAEKTSQSGQGLSDAARRTHRSEFIWSTIMKKLFVTSGSFAAIALALVAAMWTAGYELTFLSDDKARITHSSGDSDISLSSSGYSEPRWSIVKKRKPKTVIGETDTMIAQREELKNPLTRQSSSPTQEGVLSRQAESEQVKLDPKRHNSTLSAPMVDLVREMPQQSGYVGKDQFENITPNRVKIVSEEPVSTFSIDVDTSAYAFMRRSLNSGVLPQKDAVRIEELINYFDYDYPVANSAKQPFKPTVAVYPTPWNKNTKLVHIGIKGHDVVPDKKPRSNLVFLLDVSGSMSSQDKLPLLKNAMRLLVDNLEPKDTVAIVTYAGNAGTVLEPTSVSEKGAILSALENLHSGGSTAGAAGIKQAYALAKQNFNDEGINRVILATDGDFNVGITSHEELKGFIERKRDTGIYLSVLGFGQGNYNDTLMQALAQNGNGNAAYIDSLN
ncbi:MAG: VWA domain-containing protein, partial [Gammaproteobacteria bacterium]|nr:VWA domain-containing protein [Gammaproteobacteria bacterium]